MHNKSTLQDKRNNEFSKKVDTNVEQIQTDEKKISRLIESLNLKFSNLNTFYEKIESSKRALDDYMSKYNNMKQLTEENLDLRFQLQRAIEEKNKILLERPVMRREEVSMLENDIFTIRTQNEAMKKELNAEKEKSDILQHENNALVRDRKELIEKLHTANEDNSARYREIQQLRSKVGELENRILSLTMDLEATQKTSRTRVSIWDQSTTEPKGLNNPMTMKKLMDQNEKLIQEINALKNERAVIPQLGRNPNAKDVLEEMKKTHEAEKRIVQLTTDLQRSREDYEHQRALNAELSQKLGTLEYKYKSLIIEGNHGDTFRGQGSPINWSPSKRIYERENSFRNGYDSLNPGQKLGSPTSKSPIRGPNDEMEKLRAQLDAEKKWSEHLAAELQKRGGKLG